MAGETELTVIGNLVTDPDLRCSNAEGIPVANFRVASNTRVQDAESGEWRNGDTLFLSCHASGRPLAENIAESLERGMRVIAMGVLRQRTYENKEGEKRTVYELRVFEIAPALKSATAKVTKSPPNERENQ